MDGSINAYLKKANTIKEVVWFSGTTALKEGQGLCYNWDYFPTDGAVTNYDGERYNRVELPATANAMHFAGVAVQAFTASPTGRMIEIYKPGSVCNIWLKADVVIGVGIITCEAGNALGATNAGYWTRAGFEGKGSAVPLQTVTAASTAALCQVYLQEGTQSGLCEVVQPPSTGALMTLLPTGLTCFTAQTIGTGNATATLANSTVVGRYKAYQCEGTMTTNSVVVTVTSGLQKDDSTAFATGTFDADAEDVYFKWNGEQWEEESSAGVTIG